MPKKNASAKKIATMLQATAMTKDELTSVAALGGSADVAQTLENEKEIEDAHEELETESKALSLDTVPIYESTAIEINKKLSDELEECKTRYADLLEERDALQKKVDDLQKKKKDDSAVSELSVKYLSLSKDYADLQERYETLEDKYEREIEACKIQLEDAEKNYRMYDENEANYKIEIKKLRAEMKNLEIALEEKPEAKKRLEANMRNPAALSKEHGQSRRTLPPFKSNNVPPPTNGYSSWN